MARCDSKHSKVLVPIWRQPLRCKSSPKLPSSHRPIFFSSNTHKDHDSANMSTNAPHGSASVVTLNVFALHNVSATSMPNCIHLQTKEVVHPLTAPGGFVYDPSTLLQQEHAVMLTSGRTCEFCDQPATGFMSLRADYTPWIDFKDQIQGRNTLPLRSYFPFNLMGNGISSSPFAREEQTTTEGSESYQARLKRFGFYGPNQTCVVTPTCKSLLCNTQAEDVVRQFEQHIGISPDLPLFAHPFTTACGSVVCQYCGDPNIKLCKKDDKYCGFGYALVGQRFLLPD